MRPRASRSEEMRNVASRAALALWLALSGCEPAPRAQGAISREPPARQAPSHYLGEWFPIADGQCRVTLAQAALTEPRARAKGAVAEDVHVVETRWECRTRDDARVSPRALFPELTSVLRWVDASSESHPPSERTLLTHRADDALVFEVAPDRTGLVRPRHYDAHSGEPEGTRERQRAHLNVEIEGRRVVIAAWPRSHDDALDRFLDSLARTLATEVPFETLTETGEAHDSLVDAAALTRRAIALFGPRRLVVQAIETVEGQPRVTFGLEQLAHPGSVPSLRFELTRGAASWSLLRLLDPESVRVSLDCTEARRRLQARADDLRWTRVHAPQATTKDGPKQAKTDEAVCNALSVILPSSCDETDPKLLAEALRVGTRCSATSELGLDPSEPAPLPPDLQITLMRGRAASSLDRQPRYTLTMARDGRVRFTGRAWVNTHAPREGRTSERLLGALYGQLLRIAWFTRPVREERRRCGLEDEGRGDVFSVRAFGRTHAVRDRDGCRGPFTESELDLLRRAIERTAAVEAWTTPGAASDAQIWLVAAE